MAIIVISRGSYSQGKAVAEKVAERLGFECLSRDILLEASDQFNIPEIKLEHAIKDAPSFLDRFFTHGKQSYVAYIQSALTQHLCRDNIVYHGLAGHVLLKGVSHVLKVRIIAQSELRISVVMERERLDQREAAAWIEKLDRDRRKWTKALYGVDPWDPSLYDLLIKIRKYEVDDAVDLICRSVELKQFETSKASQHEMEDLALACQVKAVLLDHHSDVAVSSKYGNVVIYCSGGDRHVRKVRADIKELCTSVKGINNIEVHGGVSPPSSAV
jgi:cytidylate kinase